MGASEKRPDHENESLIPNILPSPSFGVTEFIGNLPLAGNPLFLDYSSKDPSSPCWSTESGTQSGDQCGPCAGGWDTS